MLKTQKKCFNCKYYYYDRLDDMWACTFTKYSIPTLKDDLCKNWYGDNADEEMYQIEMERKKREHYILPSEKERALSF